jgi:hypothetical protein
MRPASPHPIGVFVSEFLRDRAANVIFIAVSVVVKRLSTVLVILPRINADLYGTWDED